QRRAPRAGAVSRDCDRSRGIGSGRGRRAGPLARSRRRGPPPARLGARAAQLLGPRAAALPDHQGSRRFSWWRMIELPSESRITDIRQTGEWIIVAGKVTPAASSRALSASRSATSNAMLPALALGFSPVSEPRNSARQPPPGRSYSVQSPLGALLPRTSP